MKNKSLVILFLFATCFCFAQKVEIVHRSDYRHDYVVGQFIYIEEAADTSRLKYIATLRIHQDNYPYIISNFIERFKMEAKDLGANSFRLDSYEEKDSSVTLSVRIYFAFVKFFDMNEKKRDKNHIFIFSTERRASLEQYFYHNDSLRKFSSLQYYRLKPADKELVKLEVVKSKSPLARKILGYKFKPGKDSEFLVVGSHLPEANGFIKALVLVAAIGIAGANTSSVGPSGTPVILPGPKNNAKGIASLPYTYGRILIDMYKEAGH